MTELFVVPRWIPISEYKPHDNTYCFIYSYTGIGIAEYTDSLGFCDNADDKYSIMVTYMGQKFDICNDDISHWVPVDDIYQLANTDYDCETGQCKKCGSKFNSFCGDWITLIPNCTGISYCICQKCSIIWSQSYDKLLDNFFEQ